MLFCAVVLGPLKIKLGHCTLATFVTLLHLLLFPCVLASCFTLFVFVFIFYFFFRNPSYIDVLKPSVTGANVCASKVMSADELLDIWMTLSSSYMIMTIHLEFY